MTAGTQFGAVADPPGRRPPPCDTVADAAAPPAARPLPLLRLRSDEALVERFRQGDERAFGLLYERHRRRTFAIALGVLGDREDAADATQEAFVAAAAALRRQPVRELRPWLARVAHNAAIDMRRRRPVVAFESEEPIGPDAQQTAEMRADLQRMLAALRKLPPLQRTALVMREAGGQTYDEIGDLLDLEREAVSGLIARARVELRHQRAALDLPCAEAREALARALDGERRSSAVRRHLRACGDCATFANGLRADARTLRALSPLPVVGLLGGGGAVALHTARPTLLASLAAKGATGGVIAQIGTACAVSVCAVSGVVGGAELPHLHLGSGARNHARAAQHRHRAPVASAATLAERAPTGAAGRPATPRAAGVRSHRRQHRRRTADVVLAPYPPVSASPTPSPPRRQLPQPTPRVPNERPVTPTDYKPSNQAVKPQTSPPGSREPSRPPASGSDTPSKPAAGAGSPAASGSGSASTPPNSEPARTTTTTSTTSAPASTTPTTTPTTNPAPNPTSTTPTTTTPVHH